MLDCSELIRELELGDEECTLLLSITMLHLGKLLNNSVIVPTAPDPQGSGRVDILTHPYTTAACCAAGVATGWKPIVISRAGSSPAADAIC